MPGLTSSQRKFLRRRAHHLDPMVIIGKQGLTDMLVRSASEALEEHELIKIRFNDFKDEKKDLTEKLAFRTNSEVVGMIGHVAVLYRRHPEEDKRKIELPS